ncbi:MAG TPA: NCS2 family permease [Bacteroidales bacterium]|nr:NCS2 family permease [Bacteroidales bacterium]
MNTIEKFFRLKEHGTNVRTEVIAGITTFMTMAYILAVNPYILSQTGMDRSAVFTATAISSFIAIAVMAFYANLPIALAPGMGLNAFFAFTVVSQLGYSWEMALTAVFIEGIIFILLTFFKVREAIIDSIPMNLKHAISVGIGFFIAMIGLSNAGIIVKNDATLVSLGSVTNTNTLLALGGILVTSVLLVFRVKGALVIGIIITAIAGIPLGITKIPEGGLVSLPPSPGPVFFKFDFSKVFTWEMLLVIFTFLFVDVFDTVGTLVGVCSQADLLDEKGRVPRATQALFADAVGTTAGAILGTSTVTSYIESASGVQAGGKTGLTALTTGVLFLLALFLAPLFSMIPGVATAPALIIVGSFMIAPIQKIDFGDYAESIPVFLTILLMPLAYSISEGIAFGMISYVMIRLFTGRWKEVSLVMFVLAVFFILKHLF